MYRNDYRTAWQRADDNAAVAALDALNSDSEANHGLADYILLNAVHPAVADAYRRLQDRSEFWATA